MNENDFGWVIIKMLCVVIPCAACVIALLFALLQVLNTINLALRIGNPKYEGVYAGCFKGLGIAVASLAVCALISEIGTVYPVINAIGGDAKNIVVRICAVSFLAAVGTILWRSGVYNLKRLLGIPLSLTPKPGFKKNGFFGSLNWLPSRRRIAELQRSHDILQSEKSGLLAKLNALSAENQGCRTTLDQLGKENHCLQNGVTMLKNEIDRLKNLHIDQTRLEWAKELNVADLFAGATSPDEAAKRFRGLSKLYHPDMRNNPSGLRNLVDHLQKNNPQWFQAACYEAYLLIMSRRNR